MNRLKMILGGVTSALGITGAAAAPMIHKSFSEPRAQTSDKYWKQNSRKGGLLADEDNRKFLVAPTSENKEWWDWSYNNRFQKYEGTIDLWFNGVEAGWSDDSSVNTISKRCGDIYHENLKPRSFIIPSTQSDSIGSYYQVTEDLKKNIKDFCSIGGTAELKFPK